MTEEYFLWLHKYFEELCNNPVLENFLGLKVIEISAGKCVLGMKSAKIHGNLYGNVHGGTLSSVIDVAMGSSCLTLRKRVVTIDMNISYIKSALAGSTLTAIGEVISNGKTIMRTIGEIYDDQGQLITRSQASYFVTGDFGEGEHPTPAEEK